MCGISAIIDPSTANVTLGVEEGRNAVIAMSGVLRHRGPDSTGLVALSGCTMGHTRLSIIDLAGGAQELRKALQDG